MQHTTVAVIGTGWSNRVLIPALQAGGCEVVAVASRSEERARAVADRHGVRHATGDWRDLLTMDVDLVSVTTPPSEHHEQSIAILEAGKHLLCEKPLALDVDQAQAMSEAAARARDSQRGLVALVDHELRFTPVRRKAKQLIDGGAIGRPLMATARVASRSRIDPTDPWTWWSDGSAGGGILGAIGSHVLDGVRWLLAEELELDGAVLGRTYAERGHDGGNREVTSDDIASLVLRAGDAVVTVLVHGAALDDAIDLLTIRGTEGTIVIDRSLKLYYGKRDGPLKEYKVELPTSVPNRFRANGFAAGSVLLGQALANELPLAPESRSLLRDAATIEDGLAVQRVLDEARERAPLLPRGGARS